MLKNYGKITNFFQFFVRFFKYFYHSKKNKLLNYNDLLYTFAKLFHF